MAYALFFLIGFSFLAGSIADGVYGYLALAGLALIAPGSFAMISGVRRIFRFQRDFKWYRKTHPSKFVGGRVTCYSCGGDRINARSLMRGMYHREHFCTQCGTTLYYSPETV
jgi:hypothetical protein